MLITDLLAVLADECRRRGFSVDEQAVACLAQLERIDQEFGVWKSTWKASNTLFVWYEETNNTVCLEMQVKPLIKSESVDLNNPDFLHYFALCLEDFDGWERDCAR